MIWFVLKVVLPLAVPIGIFVLAHWLRPAQHRIIDVFRDGTLMMFCIFTALDLLTVTLASAFQRPDDDPTLSRQAIWAVVAGFVIIVVSSVVYTLNILVDETGDDRRRRAEYVAAGGTVCATLVAVIYLRFSLGLWI